MERKDLLQRHGELEELKQPELAEFRDLQRLFRPGEQEPGAQGQGGAVSEHLYDSTGMLAAENFSGGMFANTVNPADRWMALGLEDEDLAQWKPVALHLEQITNKVFASAAPASSQFYSEAPSQLGDLGVFGTGTMYSGANLETRRFVDKAVPVANSYFDVNLDGDVTEFNRDFGETIKVRHLRQRWRDAPGLDMFDENRPVRLIHATYPNPDFQPGALGDKGKAFASAYFSPDLQNFMVRGGDHEFPYHVIPWSKRSHRVWAYGPGHLARPDMATINEAGRTNIIGMHWDAEPIWLAGGDDGLYFSADDLYPDSLIWGGLREDGSRALDVLRRGADRRFSLEYDNQRRDAVRAAFYFALFQLLTSRPQVTATEFLGIQEEHLRLLAPNIVRIQNYGLSPWVTRRVRMLQRLDLLPPPPPELRDQTLTINYQSPLAKVQKLAAARASLQWVDGALALARVDPNVVDGVDTDEILKVLHEAYGVTARGRRDENAIMQIREAKAEAMKRQQQIQQAGQAVQVAAEAAHAEQASTLAQGRLQ